MYKRAINPIITTPRASRWSGSGLKRFLCASLIVSASLCAISAPQRALATEIRVRGQAKLYTDIQAAGTSAQISGILRDELGQALPQRPLTLSVQQGSTTVLEETLYTDIQGRFGYQKTLPSGAYQVSVTFARDEHLDAASSLRDLELTPAPRRLELQGPSVVVGTTRAIQLRLRATAGGVGVRAPVELHVNAQRIASIELDHYGRGVFDLQSSLAPGDNEITAFLLATPDSPGAAAQTQLRYAPSASLEARLELGHERFERGLKVVGLVSDERGPLPGGEVAVVFERVSDAAPAPEDTKAIINALGQEEPASPPPPPQPEDSALDPLTSQSTYKARGAVDERGQFSAFAPQQFLADGRWIAKVVYSPESGASIRQQTDAMTLDRSTSRLTLNILGLLTILIGVAVLSQRQLWSKLAARWRARQRANAQAKPNYDEDERIEVESLAPPNAQAISAGLFGIAGVVWDAWRDQPIAHAQLRVESADGQLIREVSADAAGQFSIDELPQGQHQLSVWAYGFARGRMALNLPHRGELSYTRISLIAIALKVRRFYQAWVQRWHGQDVWGALSPRQIEAALFEAVFEASQVLEDASAREALRARYDAFIAQEQPLTEHSVEQLMLMLTELIEESYFSQRVYEEGLWRLVVEITQRLERGLEQADQGAQP